MTIRIATLVLVLSTLSLSSCGSEPEYSEDPAEIAANDEAFLRSDPAKLEDSELGTPVAVQSDPGASYHLISSSKMANGNLEVLTQRSGPSGTSYARREVNCTEMTFRYLGEGDSLDEAKEDGPNPGEMSVAMSTSISGEVSRFACAQ